MPQALASEAAGPPPNCSVMVLESGAMVLERCVIVLEGFVIIL